MDVFPAGPRPDDLLSAPGPTPGGRVYRRIIPCLDVDDGRVVKGSRFIDLKDAGDPVELAARYDAEGADELVFLDITATSDKRACVVDLAKEVVDDVFIPFTVGGGVRSLEDAQAVLDAGADKVAVNSAAVDRPDLIDEIKSVLAGEVLVVAIDAKRRSGGDGWNVFTAGGRIDAKVDVVEWAKRVSDRGAGEILLTSMDRDGTKHGYDLELTNAVSEAADIPVIASGGAGEIEHLVDAFEAGADAVLCASIFHYGQYTIGEVKRQLDRAGIHVRL
jgi:imidazole glycerol-phosphate synthase subunit HisF